jgi:hypothetical protein
MPGRELEMTDILRDREESAKMTTDQKAGVVKHGLTTPRKHFRTVHHYRFSGASSKSFSLL